MGPYLDFASYMALVDESLFDVKGKDDKPSWRKLPSGRKRVAYRKFVMGLVFLGVFVTQGGKYNFAVSLEDWFAQKSLFYRYVYLRHCSLLVLMPVQHRFHTILRCHRESQILCHLDPHRRRKYSHWKWILWVRY